MDPLWCLRECIRLKMPIGIEDDNIVLVVQKKKKQQTVKLAKNTMTAYKVLQKQTGEQEYYSLYDLVFFWNNKQKGVGTYMKAAKEQGLRFVPFAQKKTLEKYLNGSSEGDVDVNKQVTASSSLKRPHEQAAQKKTSSRKTNMRLWAKREQPCSTVDSILECSVRLTKELESIRAQVRERQKDINGTKNSSKKAGMPIIIVPAAATSVITLSNVKKFLEQGVFEKSGQCGVGEVVVSRIDPETKIKHMFKVVNSVAKFQNRHWDRVVAVFANGPTWQFKQWRWSDPAIIFSNTQGLHVYFDDAKVNLNIKNWNVRLYPLKKQQRNLDHIQSHRMWQDIMHFMKNKKPYLLEN